MKLVLTSVLLTGLTCGVAFAADLPDHRKAPAVFLPPPLPTFSWTGFYAGANGGYAFDARTSYALSPSNVVTANGLATGARTPFLATRANGFTGGGQIGYNYEFGHNSPFGFEHLGLPGSGTGGGGGVVVGLEADAAYTGLAGSGTYAGPNGDLSLYRSRTNFIGTVRGRLGYAFGTVLIYGTGGFAYGGEDADANFLNPVGITNRAGHGSTIQTGYAYGGGVEVALPEMTFLSPFRAGAVTVKAEFLHYDLGDQQIAIQNPLPAPYLSQTHTAGNLVRAGINYKFDLSGPSVAPVVARY